MKIDLEELIHKCGADRAWDAWIDDVGALHAGVDGVSLMPELELFAKEVAAKCAELCSQRHKEDPYGASAQDCEGDIREAFGLEKA